MLMAFLRAAQGRITLASLPASNLHLHRLLPDFRLAVRTGASDCCTGYVVLRSGSDVCATLPAARSSASGHREVAVTARDGEAQPVTKRVISNGCEAASGCRVTIHV